LHTNSAVETVTRLLDMGVDPFNFSDALQGVLAQRLVRALCEKCKSPYFPERDEYEELRSCFGAAAWESLRVFYNEDFQLWRGAGCASCRGTGYKGRVGIHELLVVDDDFRKLMLGRSTVAAMSEAAKARGMRSLMQDGIAKCLKGLTDARQVRAVALK
jgi:type II secretory ATPase GspE/PulE/Tfp pilus assembly ATPase PilB-like protein